MGNQIRYNGGERTWKGRQDGDGMLRGNGCLPAVCDQFPDRIRRPHDDYLWNHSHVQVPHSIRFVHYDHWRLLGSGCNNGILQRHGCCCSPLLTALCLPACALQTEANNRIWVYMIMLLIALIVQIIMAMYFTIDPDVVSDDEGCMTYDNSTAIASCSPYNATTWCDYSTCTSSNSTCCCSCDSDCKDCLSSVQSVSDFMADYEDAVKVALWVVAIIEAVALMAAYCKMSNAEDRETATELNDDAPDLKPSDQAALHAKYGDRAVVSH